MGMRERERERGRDVLREGGCEKHITQVNSSQLLLHDSAAGVTSHNCSLCGHLR